MDDRPIPPRNWLVVALLTVVVASATSLVALLGPGLVDVAVGAVGVGIVAAALVVAVPDRLAGAWAEHRPYVYFSVGLFAFGGLLGAALLAAGIDLTELFLEALGEEFAPEDPGEEFELELTATFFVVQNTPPFLFSIAGAITLGLFTAIIMLVNGLLIGNIALSMAAVVGVDFILVGLLPHGIFELPALFVAAGVGFRLVHRFGQRILGSREAFVTKAYLSRTAVLVVFAWLLLVVAAFVEAYLTPALLDALFAARLEEAPAAAVVVPFVVG
ncbi:stage II sporulation protein M [Natronobeatus ordinarius]|uniref:stage II sporulation protein M n=1 Tax=Natronobeatus ordinarius TaxID=2963433 RepID=UPI0020CE9A45|nr:stage II sporulation protein M [Natronobeatus ordinarius]